MNPYAIIRRVFVILGYVFKVLLALFLLFITGLAGASVVGQWWGWIVGPVAVVFGLVLLVVVTYAVIAIPEWVREQEQAYQEQLRTAHEETTPVTN